MVVSHSHNSPAYAGLQVLEFLFPSRRVAESCHLTLRLLRTRNPETSHETQKSQDSRSGKDTLTSAPAGLGRQVISIQTPE